MRKPGAFGGARPGAWWASAPIAAPSPRAATSPASCTTDTPPSQPQRGFAIRRRTFSKWCIFSQCSCSCQATAFALTTAMDMTLPPAFQTSYRERLRYPETLIPSNTAIYRSKLKSYRQRLDENESQLCLIDGKDDVAEIFEVPIIDLGTHDGKGQLKELLPYSTPRLISP